MPNALKAQWVISAGVIPGQVDEELSRVWQYTGEQYDADRKLGTREGPSAYFTTAEQALSYLAWVSNPQISNWATLEFLWL